MLGRIASVGFLGLIALCTGCTLPCHPYDYCGPVNDGSGQYCSNVRAGSILEGGDMEPMGPVENQGIVEETASNVEQASPTVEAVEGATQMLSVTDHKVEESDTLVNSPAKANQTGPILAQPTTTKLRWH